MGIDMDPNDLLDESRCSSILDLEEYTRNEVCWLPCQFPKEHADPDSDLYEGLYHQYQGPAGEHDFMVRWWIRREDD